MPLAIKVDSPMTADDYVSEIRVIGDANPNPGIVRFHLTPASGRAEAGTRIRLGGDRHRHCDRQDLDRQALRRP